jgi:hypothetical protein
LKNFVKIFNLRENAHFGSEMEGNPYICLEKYPPKYASPGKLVQHTGKICEKMKILFCRILTHFWSGKMRAFL